MWFCVFLLILRGGSCEEGFRGVDTIGRVYEELEEQEVEESDLSSYDTEDLMGENQYRGKRSAFYRYCVLYRVEGIKVWILKFST